MRSASSGLAVRLAVTGLALFFAPALASAQVVCANTPTAIAAAFIASGSPTSSPDIRIVSGTYSISNSLTLKNDFYRVSGGWDGTCTQQTPNGLLTMLEAHANTPLGVTFDGQDGQVDTLTFRGFKDGIVIHDVPPSWGCCGGTPPAATISKLLRTAFIANGSVRYEVEGAPNCTHGTNFYFRDNLVAQSTDPVLATEITNCADGEVQVVHNTFLGNADRALGIFGVDEPQVFNNAFGANSRNFAWDFFPGPGDPFFCGNVGEDFSSAEASHDLPLFCYDAPKNTAADPQLDPATFRPLPGSPAIDFGWTPEEFTENRPWLVFPDRDLHADLRFTGLRPDAGAFETIGRCRP